MCNELRQAGPRVSLLSALFLPEQLSNERNLIDPAEDQAIRAANSLCLDNEPTPLRTLQGFAFHSRLFGGDAVNVLRSAGCQRAAAQTLVYQTNKGSIQLVTTHKHSLFSQLKPMYGLIIHLEARKTITFGLN